MQQIYGMRLELSEPATSAPPIAPTLAGYTLAQPRSIKVRAVAN